MGSDIGTAAGDGAAEAAALEAGGPAAAGAAAAAGGAMAAACCGQQPMPVDSEGKACRLRLLSASAPHMRTFHLAWMAHFCAVFATFAASPLLPVIRNNLDLSKAQLSTAGIAAVAGTIFSRVIMGGVCDRWGPRYGQAFIQLLTASATFGMALVDSPTAYLVARLFIGFSLASFVACQFWCSVMFTPRVVGTANAVAAGWGNSAGGIAQLIMPLLLKAISRSQPEFIAWRTCYLIVGWMQIIISVLVLLLGQDLPRGNYSALRRRNEINQSNSAREYLSAARNYRSWVLCLVYGFSFGTELTMNNVFSQYIFDTFNTSLTGAGALASVFGLSNFVTRPAGGMLSDKAAHRFGMRGRLWVLFILQSSAAGFCCGLSQMAGSLGGTMAMTVCMALTVTAASGATFGIVPFITRRGLGAANGIVGSGSSIGSITLQALFFTGSKVNWSQGFLGMGLMSLGMTALLFTIYFPMWGGMVPCGRRTGKRQSSTEEDYYAADFTKHERQMGMHHAVLNFAAEARSQRGTPSHTMPLATKGDHAHPMRQGETGLPSEAAAAAGRAVEYGQRHSPAPARGGAPATLAAAREEALKLEDWVSITTHCKGQL